MEPSSIRTNGESTAKQKKTMKSVKIDNQKHFKNKKNWFDFRFNKKQNLNDLNSNNEHKPKCFWALQSKGIKISNWYQCGGSSKNVLRIILRFMTFQLNSPCALKVC